MEASLAFVVRLYSHRLFTAVWRTAEPVVQQYTPVGRRYTIGEYNVMTRSRTKHNGHGHRIYGRGKRQRPLFRGRGEIIRFVLATA